MAGTDRFVALDIGASSIKIASFARHSSGQIELLDYRLTTLDEESQGGMAREAIVASTTKRLLDEMQVSGDPCAVSVAGHAVFSRLVKLPPVAGDKLEQTIHHEAVQNIPFPIDEVVWNYQVLGNPSAYEREALIVAAKIDFIEGLAMAAEAAGLLVERFEAAPASLHNAVHFGMPELDQPSLIVDIGSRSIDLVFIDGERTFFRSLPVSESIANGNSADAETMHKLLDRMSQEISRSISFYKSQQRGNSPELVLLTGRVANTNGLATALAQQLGIDVELLNPLQKIKVGSKVDPNALYEASHCFGELVGLAVGYWDMGQIGINLIPSSMVKARGFRKRQPLIVACAAMAVIVAATWAVGLSKVANLAKQESAQLEARIKMLEENAAQIQPIEDELAMLEQQRDTYLQVIQKRTAWLETLIDLSAVVPEGMFLTSIDPIFSGAGENRKLKGIRVAGIAYLDKHGEDDAIKDLRNSIRQAPRFSGATEVVRSPAKGLFAREFVIDAMLEEPVLL